LTWEEEGCTAELTSYSQHNEEKNGGGRRGTNKKRRRVKAPMENPDAENIWREREGGSGKAKN